MLTQLHDVPEKKKESIFGKFNTTYFNNLSDITLTYTSLTESLDRVTTEINRLRYEDWRANATRSSEE